MMTERLLGLMDEESLGIDGKAEREPSGCQLQNKEGKVMANEAALTRGLE